MYHSIHETTYYSYIYLPIFHLNLLVLIYTSVVTAYSQRGPLAAQRRFGVGRFGAVTIRRELVRCKDSSARVVSTYKFNVYTQNLIF